MLMLSHSLDAHFNHCSRIYFEDGSVIDRHKPKNRIEFLEIIDRMYERKFENVNINLKMEGLEVEYDLNDSDINRKHQACFIPYPDF
jgi:hypothetical protein